MDEREKILEEDRMVIEALDAAGVHVTSSQDLMRTRQPYPKAIPVLLDMLPKVNTYTLKEIIVRSLDVREARGRAESLLISEFESSLPDESPQAESFRWAIGNTFDILRGGKGVSEDLLRLLMNPRSGNARGPLILAIAKSKDVNAIPILLEMLDGDDLVGFAAAGLGILQAEEAITKLKTLAREHENGWVRREAKSALKRLGIILN